MKFAADSKKGSHFKFTFASKNKDSFLLNDILNKIKKKLT